jgi:hypothetical protein
MGPGLRANNVTRAVELVATGQQGLPVWPGLTSRKLRCTAARVRREEVRSWRTARLYELLLAAEQVQASKSALRTAGEQRYPSSGVGGHRPAMAACMARLNVVEAPLDGGAAGAAGKRYEAGGLPGFVSFSWKLKRCRQVSLPCGLRVNNTTQAVELVATGQQWLPVWPGLTPRKVRWMAAGAAGWRQGPQDGGRGRMMAAGAAGSSCTPADGDAVA